MSDVKVGRGASASYSGEVGGQSCTMVLSFQVVVRPSMGRRNGILAWSVDRDVRRPLDRSDEVTHQSDGAILRRPTSVLQAPTPSCRNRVQVILWLSVHRGRLIVDTG